MCCYPCQQHSREILEICPYIHCTVCSAKNANDGWQIDFGVNKNHTYAKGILLPGGKGDGMGWDGMGFKLKPRRRRRCASQLSYNGTIKRVKVNNGIPFKFAS